MWIKNNESGELINLTGCVNIRKGRVPKWAYDGRELGEYSYYIYFRWGNSDEKIYFNNEKERDNFYNQLVKYIELTDIDPRI